MIRLKLTPERPAVPRFAANLSMLYPELDFPDRFEAVARDGFEAVEFLFPYAWNAGEIAARLKALGLQQVLFNAPPGGTDAASIVRAWEAGDKGIACLPGREGFFLNRQDQAHELIDEIGAANVKVQMEWVGCEYRPARGVAPGGTSAGLGWLKPWLNS